MPINLLSAGGGTTTLTPASSASSYTITLPATTGTMALTSSVVSSLNGQTGAITNTDLYAIGSYIAGRPQNTTSYAVNSTVAGSILYAATLSAYYRTTDNQWVNGITGTPGAAGQVLVNTGTWRCVSTANTSDVQYHLSGLWVRIS